MAYASMTGILAEAVSIEEGRVCTHTTCTEWCRVPSVDNWWTATRLVDALYNAGLLSRDVSEQQTDEEVLVTMRLATIAAERNHLRHLVELVRQAHTPDDRGLCEECGRGHPCSTLSTLDAA